MKVALLIIFALLILIIVYCLLNKKEYMKLIPGWDFKASRYMKIIPGWDFKATTFDECCQKGEGDVRFCDGKANYCHTDLINRPNNFVGVPDKENCPKPCFSGGGKRMANQRYCSDKIARNDYGLYLIIEPNEYNNILKTAFTAINGNSVNTIKLDTGVYKNQLTESEYYKIGNLISTKIIENLKKSEKLRYDYFNLIDLTAYSNGIDKDKILSVATLVNTTRSISTIIRCTLQQKGDDLTILSIVLFSEDDDNSPEWYNNGYNISNAPKLKEQINLKYKDDFQPNNIGIDWAFGKLKNDKFDKTTGVFNSVDQDKNIEITNIGYPDEFQDYVNKYSKTIDLEVKSILNYYTEDKNNPNKWEYQATIET